jgi:hypothetical protein
MIFFFFFHFSFAQDSASFLHQKATDFLLQKYPEATIHLDKKIQWSIPADFEIANAAFFFQIQSHEILIKIQAFNKKAEAKIPFTLSMFCFQPKEKILPYQRIEEKNLVLTPSSSYSAYWQKKEETPMQAHGVLLPGKCILKNQVAARPDFLKGEQVRIRIHSEGVELFTMATLLSPAYTGKPVSVITKMTKKQLTGVISAAGLVEVIL